MENNENKLVLPGNQKNENLWQFDSNMALHHFRECTFYKDYLGKIKTQKYYKNTNRKISSFFGGEGGLNY